MQHLRMVLQIVGVNWMPLVMVLLDASETNFSGFGGAIDQARLGFRSHQHQTCERFHEPYWRFKVWHWSESDRCSPSPWREAERPGPEIRPYRHQWDVPAWPYLEPTKDAMADVIRLANGEFASPHCRRTRGGRRGDRPGDHRGPRRPDHAGRPDGGRDEPVIEACRHASDHLA